MTAAVRVAAAGVFASLCAASLAVGVADLSGGDGEALQTLFVSRLPRTAAALLVGAGLAIAGLVMQALAANRFVDSHVAGTEPAAAAGLVAVALLWPGAPVPVAMAGATAAALVGTAAFLAFVRRLPPTQPVLVPLFGLVFGGVIGAGVTFAAWQTDLLNHLDVWLTGDFSGVLRGRYEILWAIAVLVGAAWWLADALTVAALGRDAGVGLGLDYGRLLRIGLLIVALLSALTVAVVGMVPFVGLIVPNLVSRALGDNLRRTLPWTAFGGAALTLACDVLGRLIIHPYEVPVGVVLGVVGAAVFLRLLLTREGGRRA